MHFEYLLSRQASLLETGLGTLGVKTLGWTITHIVPQFFFITVKSPLLPLSKFFPTTSLFINVDILNKEMMICFIRPGR